MKRVSVMILSALSILALSGCQSHDKKDVNIDINATLARPVMTKEINSTMPVVLYGTATNDDVFGDCANHKIALIGTAKPNLSNLTIDLNVTSVVCIDVSQWSAKWQNTGAMFKSSNVEFAVETAPIKKQAILITKESITKKALKALGLNQDPEKYIGFVKDFEPIVETEDNNPVVVNIKTIQRQ